MKKDGGGFTEFAPVHRYYETTIKLTWKKR